MLTKIEAISKFLKKHRINADMLEISADKWYFNCNFRTSNDPKDEERKLTRSLKRVFGPMEAQGSEGYKYLTGSVEIPLNSRFSMEEEQHFTLKCSIFGAFVCTVIAEKTESVELTDWEKESKLKELERLKAEIETGHRSVTRKEYTCEPSRGVA